MAVKSHCIVFSFSTRKIQSCTLRRGGGGEDGGGEKWGEGVGVGRGRGEVRRGAVKLRNNVLHCIAWFSSLLCYSVQCFIVLHWTKATKPNRFTYHRVPIPVLRDSWLFSPELLNPPIFVLQRTLHISICDHTFLCNCWQVSSDKNKLVNLLLNFASQLN